MAMCALSAYRIKQRIAPAGPELIEQLDPEIYLKEAVSSVELALVAPKDTDELQAISLLSLAGLERGDTALVQQYLGLYHATVAKQTLYDESRWPALPTLEKEQWRRMYWYMYRLEVHVAMVMGHAVRCPELQSLVSYPEIPDADGEANTEETEWLTGWNFVTDLYRGLEHLVTKLRLHRLSAYQGRATKNFSTTSLLSFDPQTTILEPLKAALDNLPVRCRQAEPLSSNVAMNRCGFQVTNIACTYQLARIMTYSFSKATFTQACRTAIDLVEEMAAIPIDYLRWTTLAATQELSGMGHILSHFIRKDLSITEYRELRNAMLCMTEFLDSLQSNFPYVVRASLRLGKYVEEIDHMIEQVRTDVHGPALGSLSEPFSGQFDQPIPFLEQDAVLAWMDAFFTSVDDV